MVIVPGSLMAHDSSGALLRSKGGTWLNESLATQFDPTDIDGKVKVVACKNEVRIELDGSALRKTRRRASPPK